MGRLAGGVVSLLLVTGVARADYYKVRNTNDSGYGSLRWAIDKANTHVGSDWIVFDSALAGSTIQPVTALAPLADPGTIIDGDLNDDGDPDVALQPWDPAQHPDPALDVRANNCRVEGLAVSGFQGQYAVKLTGVTGCLIRGCDILGNTGFPTVAQLMLDDCDGNTIGQAGYPNLIVGHSFWTGLWLYNSSYNTVQCNHFGLTRAGDEGIDHGCSMTVSSDGGGAVENVIRNNRFAASHLQALGLGRSHRNRVQGNWFGLAADGVTPIRSEGVCIVIGDGAAGNVIGGTSATARNVFTVTHEPGSGATTPAIHIQDSTTRNTQIRGNYFGATVDGFECVPLKVGVRLLRCARQVIGGPSRRAGNYFVLEPGDAAVTGVKFEEGGSESVIQNNRFGVLPCGIPAPHDGANIRIDGASGISILDNRVAYASFGIRFGWTAASGLTQIHGNTFEHLRRGVYLTNAVSACLGDVGNPSTDDDGGNEFALTNTIHILNRNTSRVPAEGNSFGTTVAAEIDARILDQLDWPAYGRVDFDPLQGGISPSGCRPPHGLALSGAGAVATAAGAEVAYTLSAPSAVTVTISNLAGRPIATVIQDRPSEEGLQRVVWNGQSARGTRAPNGRYLVRIQARAADGEHATAIAPLVVGR